MIYMANNYYIKHNPWRPKSCLSKRKLLLYDFPNCTKLIKIRNQNCENITNELTFICTNAKVYKANILRHITNVNE